MAAGSSSVLPKPLLPWALWGHSALGHRAGDVHTHSTQLLHQNPPFFHLLFINHAGFPTQGAQAWVGSVPGEVMEGASKSRTWKSACSAQAAPSYCSW